MELKYKSKEQDYSYRNFEDDLKAVLYGASMYLNNLKRIDCSEIAYARLEKIEVFYDNVSLNTLAHLYDTDEFREIFHHISKVKGTLPIFRQALDAVFEKRSREALEDLETKAKTMVENFNIIIL